MQLQNLSLTCIQKNKALLSATSILPRSLRAYNTTASSENFYRLYGFWQVSRQIWTIFSVQKRFQLLGSKSQGIQGR